MMQIRKKRKADILIELDIFILIFSLYNKIIVHVQ